MTLTPKILLFLIFAFIGYILTAEKNRHSMNWDSNNAHIDCYLERCTGFCNKKFCKIDSSCRPVNRTSKLRRLDIYFHDGVTLEAPVLLAVSTFKKFATQYRPLMYTFKDDVCKLFLLKDHHIFSFFGGTNINGTLLDPCPISGHRYQTPRYSSLWIGTLVPTGEWRIDFTLSKVIDGVEEHIGTASFHFLIKAKTATEF